MNPFPSINENNRPVGLFEPHTPNLTPRFEPDIGFHPNNPSKKTNPIFKPDWTPDFGEHIDIEADSIGLALSILGISKSQYNTMSIKQLKGMRRIDCDNNNIYAVNILIYYKKNSRNLLFPEINPIVHSHIKPNLNQYSNEDKKTFAKIYPEIDEIN